jgi:hypothetical protein
MPCKEPVRMLRNTLTLYRPCTARFEPECLNNGRTDMLANEPDVRGLAVRVATLL